MPATLDELRTNINNIECEIAGISDDLWKIGFKEVPQASILWPYYMPDIEFHMEKCLLSIENKQMSNN